MFNYELRYYIIVLELNRSLIIHRHFIKKTIYLHWTLKHRNKNCIHLNKQKLYLCLPLRFVTKNVYRAGESLRHK